MLSKTNIEEVADLLRRLLAGKLYVSKTITNWPVPNSQEILGKQYLNGARGAESASGKNIIVFDSYLHIHDLRGIDSFYADDNKQDPQFNFLPATTDAEYGQVEIRYYIGGKPTIRTLTPTGPIPFTTKE